MRTCYPELDKVLATAEWDDTLQDYSLGGQERIREAVGLERTRLWNSQPPGKEADTELGRDIQKQTGAPSVVINRIVREAARKRLRSTDGEGKKPN
jgi:hypothetical protein